MSRKKVHHEEEEKLERWLVSYADFITLLFAFFTVMYALSMSDKAKYKNAVENIQRAFMSAGGIFPLRGSPFTPFEKPADRGSMLPPTLMEPGQFSKSGQSELERMQEQIEGLFEKTTGISNSPGEIDIVRFEKGIKIRLGEHVLFNPNNDKLKREHIPFLYEVAKQLGKLGYPIQIEGHTDNREPIGRNNWDLSLARSYNILKFMVQAAKFPKDKISMSAFGETTPIAQNETAEGRAKNRRVEIAVFLPDKDVPEIPW